MTAGELVATRNRNRAVPGWRSLGGNSRRRPSAACTSVTTGQDVYTRYGVVAWTVVMVIGSFVDVEQADAVGRIRSRTLSVSALWPR